MSLQTKIPEYLKKTEGFSAGEIIEFAHREFGSSLKLASSLGEEDQVLTDLVSKLTPEVVVFTLDTGRLFQETYDLLAETQKKYDLTFEIYYPDTEKVESMVREKGINLFYESIENRKTCCGIRKVGPLKRAIDGVDAWITGLRRSQGVTRTELQAFEWDEGNGMIKVNPLASWSLDELHTYIETHGVPTNPLHKKGFVSIGCAPCTRAIEPGEDIRAGRWWWEDPEHKECGLHNVLQRAREAKNKS